MQLNRPKLLAPAGNWIMLNAVIKSGADAIYFGIREFNMRAQAENFTIEDIPEIVRIANEKNVETHLTMNTILYDEELLVAEQIIEVAKESGVNEIICWDFSVIELCRKHKMPFCISTQASVSNSLAANYFASIGAKRVVLARECSLEQMTKIIADSNIEIEAFVHGAMCIAVSGRCFMSHELFGRSANRGDCIQPCRREYQIYDERKENSMILGQDYVMSSKDLCSIEFLDKLIESGIHIFKIEGRKRSPEYAAKATEVYRRAIDAYFDSRLTNELKQILSEELNAVFNRGFTSGFYNHLPGKDDFATEEGNISPVKKEYIGKIINYFKVNQVAFIKLESGELSEGDEIYILGKTSGVIELKATAMQVNDVPNSIAIKGDTVTLFSPERVRNGDKVYLKKITR